MEDTHSVASGQSASLGKMECPHCSRDFQVRSLFKHIRLNHFSDFIDSINDSKCKLNSDPEAPLEITWTKKNDFDEEELLVFYACLATDKAFVTSARALAHFKKDKKAFTEHKKQMRKLFADIDKRNQKRKMEVNNSPMIIRWRKALEENDPLVAAAYWRNILWYQKAATKIFDHARTIFPDFNLHTMYLQYETYNAERVSLSEWHTQKMAMDVELWDLKYGRCMDHQKLTPFYKFYEKFTTVLLRHLIDTHTEFYRYYRFDSPDCVRIRWSDYTDEFFLCANKSMPSLEESLAEDRVNFDKLTEDINNGTANYPFNTPDSATEIVSG
jgi:hypothetical protein